MEILIATQNKGKVREYAALFDGLPVTLLSLDDVGLGGMDVEETGATFAENAQLKALAYAQASGRLTLADDSGLCVDALDGAPGVYSARYAGPGQDDAGRRRHLLQVLDGVPLEKRGAYFACVIALADPHSGTCEVVEGRCEGRITLTEQDDGHGFGYDPLFIPDGHDRTFAQIPKAEKNRISHRGRAAQALVPVLRAMADRA
jgi:XTP/dITP diphosphohydrolase